MKVNQKKALFANPWEVEERGSWGGQSGREARASEASGKGPEFLSTAVNGTDEASAASSDFLFDMAAPEISGAFVGSVDRLSGEGAASSALGRLAASENAAAKGLVNSAAGRTGSEVLFQQPEITAASIATNDPLLGQQWHLAAIGVDKLYDEYRGSGIKIGVYDDGLQKTHTDLAGNYDSNLEFRLNGNLVNPGVGTHGTAVAGIIAAVGDNGQGGVGVASESTIAGVNVFSGGASGTNLINAMRHSAAFDVTNNSWNWTGRYADNINVTGGFGAQFAGALKYAADTGRGGLGTVIVNSAGNDWLTDNRDANYSGFNQSRHTVTVGAVADTGVVAWYSNKGASVLVSAPSSGGSKGIVTTDVMGAGGYNSGDYTTTFGGTSAAAPIVAGVVALMLEANPMLGWRDVQEILALTADHTGSALGGARVGMEAFGWTINGAVNYNGGGMHFSNDYGFGQVDAYAAVRMAEVYALFGSAKVSGNEAKVTAQATMSRALNDNQTASFTFNVAQDISIENVDLTLRLTHPDVNQLRVVLISPDGTQSIVLTPGTGTAFAANNWSWTFGSRAFLGEMSAGNWTVQITDTRAGGTGSLHSYKFEAYGSAASANDVYHYTEDFAKMLAHDASRAVLSDTNGGVDWVNASVFDDNLVIDLRQGAQSTVGGQNLFRIANGSVIENAVGGSGDDVLIGNDAANHLVGGRGNDTLIGMGGANILDGGVGVDTASYAYSNAAVDVDLLRATQVGGHAQGDRLISIENVTGSGHDDVLRGDNGDNVLSGGAGDDILIGRGGNNVLNGGTGFDRVSYEWATQGMVFDAASSVIVHERGQDTLISIEGIIGTDFDDVFRGVDGMNNWFDGRGGDNLFVSSTGQNTYTGGSGFDTVDYSGSASAVTVDLFNGVGFGGDAQGDRLFNIEKLIASAHGDTLLGNNSDNHLIGGIGNDRLLGRGGSNILDGGEGVDLASYVYSNQGVDVDLMRETQIGGDAQGDRLISIENLQGSIHDDILFGDDGNNVFWAEAGNDVIDPRGGTNRIHAGDGDDLVYSGRGNNTIDGGNGNDTVSYEKAALGFNVNLATGIGFSTDGTLRDRLANIQNLTGSDHADRLIGNGQNNVLDGGRGNDVLTGNGGSNIFAFSEFGWGNDMVTDFKIGTDRLSLVGSGMTWDDLTISQSGTSTMVTSGAGSIMLLNVAAGSLGMDEFMFA